MACVTTMIPVGRHRLAATVFGEGAPAVVIEPAFGGNAAAWRSIAERIAGETTVVTYDRAPYGPSSPARDSRSPARIVADLEEVLGHLEITGQAITYAGGKGRPVTLSREQGDVLRVVARGAPRYPARCLTIQGTSTVIPLGFFRLNEVRQACAARGWQF